MTNKEILEKAIKKAIYGGFDAELKDGWVASGNLHARTDGKAPYDIIFSHQFAKALWGEELGITLSEGQVDTPLNPEKEWTRYKDYANNANIKNWKDLYLNAWQFWMPLWAFHLQQMVIAEDPIKYLGENI